MTAQTLKVSMLCLSLLVFGRHRLSGQAGCTDAQAINFQIAATQNDGSCIYPPTSYTPLFHSTLPSQLNEISGLAFQDEWWCLNDGGNDPVLYSILPASGAIIKKVTLQGAVNKDWEDLAASGDTLYIGDFGNNQNNRTDLAIYKLPLSAIGSGNNQNVAENEYQVIPFSYPDQVDFNTQPEDSTVFDCEAMIYHDGWLHLFTKNHRDYTTTHYRLNPANGHVEKIGSFDTGGMITGASISPDSQVIALAGYQLNGLPTVFCWFLWDWQQPGNFFSGNKRRIELGSALLNGQLESIAFSSARAGYLGNEKTIYNGVTLVNPGLRRFECGAWIPETSAEKEPQLIIPKVYYNPPYLLVESSEITQLRVFDTLGRLCFSCEHSMICYAALKPGKYWVQCTSITGEASIHPVIVIH